MCVNNPHCRDSSIIATEEREDEEQRLRRIIREEIGQMQNELFVFDREYEDE